MAESKGSIAEAVSQAKRIYRNHLIWESIFAISPVEVYLVCTLKSFYTFVPYRIYTIWNFIAKLIITLCVSIKTKNKIMKKNKGLAIITGASQGIGSAIAIGIANDGYRVVLIARNKQNLDKVYDEIMKLDDNVFEPIVLPLDITDYTKIDNEVRSINQRYGAIDILVNAAAIFMDGSLNESVDNFKKIIETNVVAQYAILKTVTEIMKTQKSGYIFNIASRAAKYGFPGGGIYGSTKFAFVGLTESLYRELALLGIRITSLCPEWVNAEMAKKAGTPFEDEEMIQPNDLLETIRYLLNLSENVCIKEVVIEMKKSII
jgi:short-subunit dehydrogenase